MASGRLSTAALYDTMALRERTLGFSLQELLFVLTVLAVLSSYTHSDIQARFEHAKIDATANSMHALREAAMSYRARNGHWPNSVEHLDAWLGEDVTVRHRNGLGFDYSFKVDRLGTTPTSIARLRIITGMTDVEQAQDLRALMGVWAVAHQTSVSLSVLPPDQLLASAQHPYLFDQDLLLNGHAINNLGHIRLHEDGAHTTLIVDRLFVYNFVADRVYAKNFIERNPITARMVGEDIYWGDQHLANLRR